MLGSSAVASEAGFFRAIILLKRFRATWGTFESINSRQDLLWWILQKGVQLGNKLYVRNLGSIVNVDKLEEMFSSVGEVTSAKIETKSILDRLYRVAYITMETAQQAAEGIERFHGQKLNGDSMVVTLDIPHVPLFAKPKSKSKSKSKSLSK